MKRKLATLGLGIFTTGLAVTTCARYLEQQRKENGDLVVNKQVDGYNVRADSVGRLRRISISEGNNYLTAMDGDNDGRFDEIILENVPKGHPLELLANLPELERVYSEATRK